MKIGESVFLPISATITILLFESIPVVRVGTRAAVWEN